MMLIANLLWVIAKKDRQEIMRLIILMFVLVVVLDSCSSNYSSDKFDKDVWLLNNDISNRYNPRANMTKDLIENYLRPGMHRDSIIILLGRPYLEKIENRLPKGLEVPDSLSISESLDTTQLEKFNTWYETNSQPDTLMRYPIGWSTIDPIFLIIKLRSDSTTFEFWIEQG